MFKTQGINSNNPKYTIERWNEDVAYLEIDGQAFNGRDCYLRLRFIGDGNYWVDGIFGFGGMGYRGPVSTRRLLKGLNNIGFDLTASRLRRLFKSQVR